METADEKKSRKSLEQQLAAAQLKAAQLKARLASRDAREEHMCKKIVDRKKYLIGAMIIGALDSSEIKTRMDKFLTRDAERKLFDLDPIE